MQRVELLLQVTDFFALLFEALGLEAAALAGDFLLALAQVQALGFDLAEIGVELVEEAGDVLGLGAETAAGVGDDLRIEADLLGDVDSGRGSGDADAQLVGGRESFLVEADGGVEDSGGVGGVDLERGVVGGDDGERLAQAEVFGDGDGERGSLFGIGGRAEFVEQDERAGGGGVGDEIDVGDVGGKGGEILLDGLRVADVGQNGVADGKIGALGGDGDSGLGHEDEQAHGFEADGFAAGVGAADDELTVSGSPFPG